MKYQKPFNEHTICLFYSTLKIIGILRYVPNSDCNAYRKLSARGVDSDHVCSSRTLIDRLMTKFWKRT